MTSRPIPKAGADPDYGRSLRRLLTGVTVAVMIALFAIWRIDNARVESLRMAVVDRGVMLTGGGSLLGDLDLALREQTGLAITVAEDPLNCVALGTGKSLEYETQLAHVLEYN